MSFEKEQGWTNWKQVQDWLLENNFKELAKCMGINNMLASSVGGQGETNATFAIA